jgi:hypothetical protein
MSRTEQNSSEPHVTLFGESLSDEREGSREDVRNTRKVDSEGHVLFGLLIIFGGLILLGNTLGAISWDFWHAIAPFWPVLLVLAGISTLLGPGFGSNLLMFVIALFVLSVITTAGLERIDSPLVAHLPQGLVELSRSLITFTQRI